MKQRKLYWFCRCLWNLRYNWKWEGLWALYRIADWSISAFNPIAGWIDTHIRIRIDYDRESAMVFLGDLIGSKLIHLSLNLHSAWDKVFYGPTQWNCGKSDPSYVPPKFKKITWLGFRF